MRAYDCAQLQDTMVGFKGGAENTGPENAGLENDCQDPSGPIRGPAVF